MDVPLRGTSAGKRNFVWPISKILINYPIIVKRREIWKEFFLDTGSTADGRTMIKKNATLPSILVKVVRAMTRF